MYSLEAQHHTPRRLHSQDMRCSQKAPWQNTLGEIGGLSPPGRQCEDDQLGGSETQLLS
jgi:hypothetical protein